MVSPVQSTIGNTFNLDSTLDFDASVSSTASFIFTPYTSATIRVVWGDGTIEVFNFSQQTTISHTYNNTAVNRIQLFNINSSLQRFRIANGFGDFKAFKLNSQDLPKGAEEYIINSQDLSEDNFAKFPDATGYSLRNSVFVATLADAPSGIDDLDLSRSGGRTFPKVSGSLSDLQMANNFTRLKLQSADLSDSFLSELPKGGQNYNVNSCSFKGDGDLNVICTLSANLTLIDAQSLNRFGGTYTTKTYTKDVSSASILVQKNSLSTTEVDQFLVDLDNSGSTDGTLVIGGSGFNTNAAPSSTGQNAVNSLVNKGWSITTS